MHARGRPWQSVGSRFASELQALSLGLVESRPPTFSTSRWWTVRQAANDSSVFDTTPHDGLKVIVATETVTGGVVASALTAGGILTFYAVTVCAIGRAVRSACGGSRYRMIFDEMPEVHDLVDLCEGVYIARHEGQLLAETELHETVLRLYRSPVSLLQLTGERLER